MHTHPEPSATEADRADMDGLPRPTATLKETMVKSAQGHVRLSPTVPGSHRATSGDPPVARDGPTEDGRTRGGFMQISGGREGVKVAVGLGKPSMSALSASVALGSG